MIFRKHTLPNIRFGGGGQPSQSSLKLKERLDGYPQNTEELENLREKSKSTLDNYPPSLKNKIEMSSIILALNPPAKYQNHK